MTEEKSRVRIIHFTQSEIESAENEIAELLDQGYSIVTAIGHGGANPVMPGRNRPGTAARPTGGYIILVKPAVIPPGPALG